MDFHPCLVLDVFVDEQTGEPWVVAAFGTSRNTGRLVAGEFAVLPEHGAAFAKSGLRKPTKFLLERHRLAKLPYNDEWFAVPPERRGLQTHPRVGVLDAGRYQKALQAAGNAVDIARTLRDLEAVAVGALSSLS